MGRPNLIEETLKAVAPYIPSRVPKRSGKKPPKVGLDISITKYPSQVPEWNEDEERCQACKALPAHPRNLDVCCYRVHIDSRSLTYTEHMLYSLLVEPMTSDVLSYQCQDLEESFFVER